MARLRLGGVVVLVGLTLAACAGGDSTSDPSGPTVAEETSTSVVSVASTTPATLPSTEPTEPTTTEPTTSEPTTAEPTTTASSITTPPTTTTAPPSTTAACEFEGSVEEVVHDFPLEMSAEVGTDIRTGAHDCFERVVIELGPAPDRESDGAPGYWVRYATGPLTLGQTDDQFVELAGDADLLITVNAWMSTFDASSKPVGYQGPIDFVPTNVEVIEQLRLLDNFEGTHTWAVGLDHERAFSVRLLPNPTRIVVDISTE
jgi:hypothetical protein